MPAPIVIADSITRVGPEAAGAVVVNASHGGVYAAYLAAKLHAAAAIFNDAGVGRDRAGIAGLDYLQDFGIAAATVGHDTARIGDGADMMAQRRHHPCERAAPHRSASPRASRAATLPLRCNRRDRRIARRRKRWKRRSCSSPKRHRSGRSTPRPSSCPSTRTAIVITGSHGGLLGGRPETALKYDVLGALYNDAGIGKDAAGISRLPALDARGIAAATVSAASARIGDARSTYEDGIISRVNARAAALGLREGISAREFVAGLRRALAA